MMSILFASDLDNTLIYSYKSAQNEDVCVEFKNAEKLSFMPPKTYLLLKEVVQRCIFVPVTTRSLEQYRRIDLGVKPKYALAANGALLLVDGEIDKKWALETEQMLNFKLPNLTESYLLFDIRYVDSFFIAAKSEQPQSALEYLKNIIDERKFTLYAVKNKIYVIPNNLSKGIAVKRLKKRLQTELVICAGDSEIDISMLEIADFALYPKTLNIAHRNSHVFDNDFFTVKALQTAYLYINKK